VLGAVYNSYLAGGKLCLITSPGYLAPVPSMQGKLVLVTGGNAGIGWQTVKRLAQAGATVILACRSLEKGHAMVSTLPSNVAKQIIVMELDLSKIASIRAFAATVMEKFPRLHVLVLNAGLAHSFMAASNFRRTDDGLEEVMGVNYLGHFLLTNLLLPVLRNTPTARVIALSSCAMANSYRRGIDPSTWVNKAADYHDLCQYGQSKLAMRLFMEQLQQREPALLCVSCHPGIVAETGIVHAKPHPFEWLFRAIVFNMLGFGVAHGGDNSVWCATAPEKSLEPGACYFPVGRPVTWKAHPLMRVGVGQSPFARTSFPPLWEESARVINECAGKTLILE